MMDFSGKIIIVSGTSGSGKTTLVTHLLTHKDLNLVFSVSACSRKKRNSEENGKNYLFLSQLEFKNKIKNNEFLEWEEVYPNHFYGTLKSSVEQVLKSGKNILFDVDVKGALTIKDYFKDQARTIFIAPNSIETAKFRLIHRRTETESDLCQRIDKMTQELKFANKMDYKLLNDNLSTAKQDIYNDVKKFLAL